MEIIHAWHTFNIAEALAAFIPFKSKRYAKKLGNACPNDISKIIVEHSISNTLKATIVQHHEIVQHYDMPRTSCKPIMYAYGISMRDLWDNVLDTLASFKNMRNAEELCIWLDLKEV